MIVYRIKNRITNKVYIGITRGDLNRRWRAHVNLARKGVVTALYHAIRKYGENSFDLSVVEHCDDIETLKQREIAHIAISSSRAPHGYNLTAGGDGQNGMDQQVRQRLSLLARGRTHTEEAKRKISSSGRGRVTSDETKNAISAAHRGKTLSPEHRAKMSEAAKRRSHPKRSPEHIAKMHEGLRRYRDQQRMQNVPSGRL